MEALESPHDGRAVRLVDGLPVATAKDPHLSSVARHGYLHDNVRTVVGFLVDGLEPDTQLDLALFAVLLNYWHDLERQVDVFRDAIGHHVEDAIWRDESNGAISIKLAKTNTLVELNVVYHDTLVC